MGSEEYEELNFCYNCMRHLDDGEDVCPACGYDSRIRKNPGTAMPEGTILSGKYFVGRMLGQGGFGITYLGIDLKLQLRVAIKEYFPMGLSVREPYSVRVTTISSVTDPEGFHKGRDEFQSEAQRLALFDSPNIVHVRDYFLENGTAYIVMDYVEGNSLTEEVAECGGKMPWKRVLSLFKPLIMELDNLHQKHLIHRDIKPDNLKVEVDENGKEHLVLLDFGAARNFVSSQITKTYTAMVTPGYAPLEQYSSSSRQGPFTDIYALCATMYAAITGIVPAVATDRVIGEGELQSFVQLGLSVPSNIEKAIFHGLEILGPDRPQTMRELYSELTETPEKHSRRLLFLVPLLLAVILAGGYFINRHVQDVSIMQTTQAYITQTVFETGIQKTADRKASGTPEPTSTKTPQPTNTLAPTSTKRAAVTATRRPTSTPTRRPTAAATRRPTSTPTRHPTATATRRPTSTPTRHPTAAPTRRPTSTPVPAKSRPSVGSVITFGSYEQDNNRSNGKESIRWKVLDVQGNKALLLSTQILDAQQFHNSAEIGGGWASSRLRTWMMNDFYNSAFSGSEKKAILTTAQKATSKDTSDDYDTVFILSTDQVKKYLSSSSSRQFRASAYAIQARKVFKGADGYYNWWTRSNHIENGSFWKDQIDIIRKYGEIAYTKPTDADCGILPAVWIDISTYMNL